MYGYEDVSEIIPNRLYLTSIYGLKHVNNPDIVISILHYNPKLENKYPNAKCYYWNAEDEDDFQIEYYFDIFKQIMDENPDKTVYVHCLAGVSRSATIVASYLVHHLPNPKRNAISKIISFLKKKRPVVSPNDGFIQKLIEYRFQILGRDSGNKK